MTKIITISAILLLCVCFNNANAQVSVGADFGMLKSIEKDTDSDAIFGASLNVKYNISDKLRVGANLGYYGKSYDIFGEKLRTYIMPISGLVEYSFSENAFSPYAGLDLGFYNFGVSIAGEGESEGYFGFAPVAGFNYSLTDNLLVNFNVKYHYVMVTDNASSLLGVNAGISYKF